MVLNDDHPDIFTVIVWDWTRRAGVTCTGGLVRVTSVGGGSLVKTVWRRNRSDDDGASTVEFALILIPFVVLAFGMVQYGWYFYVAQTTGGAASNVARRLQVGDCWGTDEARDLAKNQAAAVTGVTTTPSTLTGATPGVTQIVVTVQADGRILGFLPMPDDGQVVRTVKAQLEDTTAGASCP